MTSAITVVASTQITPSLRRFHNSHGKAGGQWLNHNGSLNSLITLISEQAIGTYVLLLGPDDIPSSGLNARLTEAIATFPLADVIYGDIQDSSSAEKHVSLPSWSPARLAYENYVGHTFLIRTEFLVSLNSNLVLSEDWDPWSFLLTCIRLDATVEHDKHVWVSTPPGISSVFDSISEVPEGIQRNKESLAASRTTLPQDLGCDVITLTAGTDIPESDQHVTYIEEHLDALSTTQQQRFTQHIVVIGPECSPRIREDLDKRNRDNNLRLVTTSERFNFSSRNNEARALSDANILVFVNDDFVPQRTDWLELLVAPFADPHVAITGGTLLYPDGSIQHAGIGLIRGNTYHSHLRVNDRDAGWSELIMMNREVDAVTGACLAIRSEVFDDIGGFFEGLPVNYNDIDLCFKARAAGYSVVLVGTPLGIHYESTTRTPTLLPEETSLFIKRWPERAQSSRFPFRYALSRGKIEMGLS